MSSKETSSRGDKREGRFGDQGQNQIVNNRHVMGCCMILKTGLVFMQGDIARIMQRVFDLPVGAQHMQELGRRGLFRSQTGHAINCVLTCFLGLRYGSGSFELEDLLQEGPIEKIIELAASGE